MAEMTNMQQESSFGREHIPAAAVAAVASIVVHIGLVWMAGLVNLQLLGRTESTRPPRKYESIALGAVEVNPETQEEVLTALRALGGDAPLHVAESVEEFRVEPELAATEPPVVDEGALAGETEAIAEPSAVPAPEAWTPKQAIMAVENAVVKEVLPGLERRLIPSIERVPDAPDLFLTPSRERVPGATAIGQPVAPQPVADIAEAVVGGAVESAAPEGIDESVAPGGERELFEETPEEVTDVDPIEQVLTASIETYSNLRDYRYGYFKLEVERAGKQLLPVRPKDIMLVQDCSASMSEQRLYFCREGLRRSLAHIGAADRFNIARFADNVETCFEDWVTKTPETLEQAEEYINSMQSVGYTDLFASMRDLLSVDSREGRPVVAFVITDGLANKGVTDNTQIIGEFSRLNAGRISVFTMGTFEKANQYLIDLLSYCNKGHVNVVTSGRWDIPDVAESVMLGISRPVLSDLRLQFSAGSSVEVYPQQVSNLYLDRPLVLYGRYRKGETRLVFQAVGQAGSRACDMVFDLPLAHSPTDSMDKSIRQKWARQKIYHLIGEYARSRNRDVLLELRRTARTYNEEIPYKRSLF
jgi:hypothetical protein